jgi:hypothetical protein
VRKFLNIDTEHNSQNAEQDTGNVDKHCTLLDSNIRNSVCTPAKLPCRRVVKGSDALEKF